MTHKVYVNGRVHVRNKRCSTCIFGNTSPVDVERREGMIKACSVNDGVIPCHHHLHDHSPIEPVCRGFFDLDQTISLRLAALYNVLMFVDDDLNEVT